MHRMEQVLVPFRRKQEEQELELWHRKVQGPGPTMGRELVQVQREPSWTVVEHCEGNDERGPKKAGEKEINQYHYLRVCRLGGWCSKRIIVQIYRTYNLNQLGNDFFIFHNYWTIILSKDREVSTHQKLIHAMIGTC